LGVGFTALLSHSQNATPLIIIHCIDSVGAKDRTRWATLA